MDQILRRMTLEFFGSGKLKITPEMFLEADNAFFLDVRSQEEAESITIKLEHHPNILSKNIPIDELPDRIEEIPKDKLIGAFCPAKVRSTMAFAYLLFKGFENVRIVEGGYLELTEALLPGKILKLVKTMEEK